MDGYRLTEDKMAGFAEHLKGEEHGSATIEKYLRNVRFFAGWLGGGAVTKGAVAGWKAHLQEEGFAPCTVNAKLSALNKFFAYAGLEGCRVKFLHIQRKVFRDGAKDLSRGEYVKLLEAAKRSGKEQLGLAIEAIGATGIVLYYTGILPAGGETSALSDTLTIKEDAAMMAEGTAGSQEDAEKGTEAASGAYGYHGLRFVLEAEVNAVQTHNAEDAIKSAWGVDVSVGADGSLNLR